MPSPAPRKLRQRTEKYHGNITKRGAQEVKKKPESAPIGPVLLGLFLFVVVGSALLQIFRSII